MFQDAIMKKIETVFELREEIVNMNRKLLKSHGGVIHFNLEEFICEQPCATVEDLNSFFRITLQEG